MNGDNEEFQKVIEFFSFITEYICRSKQNRSVKLENIDDQREHFTMVRLTDFFEF